MAGSGTAKSARELAQAQQLATVAEHWLARRTKRTTVDAARQRWERVWRPIASAALSGNPAVALPPPKQEDMQISLIEEVRGLDYTIADLFDELRGLRDSVFDTLGPQDTPHAVQALERYRSLSEFLDSLLGDCLAKTSLIHELVIEGAARGYCQLDTEGQIISANASMNRLLQVDDCRGHHLPQYFGAQKEFVENAVLGHDRDRPVLRRMDLFAPNGCKVPVTAEFGSIVVDGEKCGGYAIVVDVSSLIKAEYKAYEASELGILKFDLNLCITYANKTARLIFGDVDADLVGTSARTLFPEDKSQAKITEGFARRRTGQGSTYELNYHRAQDDKTLPLRINAMPEYDNLDEMSGVFVVVENILVDRVGKEIQGLIQEHNKGHHLFEAMFEKLKPLVDFDFGTISIYSRDMSVARAIHFHPRPEPMWPTLWFTTTEELKNWIEGRSEAPRWQPNITAFLEYQQGTDEIAQDPTVELLVAEGYKSFICYPIWQGNRVAAAVTLLSRKEAFFDEGHFKILEEVPIDKVIRTGLAYRDRAEHSFLHRLNKQIAAQNDTQGVASAIVKELARFFQWQNVSIFKVNQVRNAFELLAQSEGPLYQYALIRTHEPSPGFRLT